LKIYVQQCSFFAAIAAATAAATKSENIFGNKKIPADHSF
jgi:hypothetical protein